MSLVDEVADHAIRQRRRGICGRGRDAGDLRNRVGAALGESWPRPGRSQRAWRHRPRPATWSRSPQRSVSRSLAGAPTQPGTRCSARSRHTKDHSRRTGLSAATGISKGPPRGLRVRLKSASTKLSAAVRAISRHRCSAARYAGWVEAAGDDRPFGAGQALVLDRPAHGEHRPERHPQWRHPRLVLPHDREDGPPSGRRPCDSAIDRRRQRQTSFAICQHETRHARRRAVP